MSRRAITASLVGTLGAVLCSAGSVYGAPPVIQPGSEIFIDRYERGCSAGYMLRGSDKHRYMLMSGYCAAYGGGPWPLEPKFDRVYRMGKGPTIRLADKTIVGWVVHAYAQAPFPGDMFDFAVVRLAPTMRASPRVIELGGPTSTYTDVNNEPTTVQMSGAGGYTLVVAAREQTRQGVLVYGPDSPTVVWPELPGYSRDTGAPVLIGDRQALGIYSGYTATEGGDAGSSRAVRHAGDPVFRIGPLLAIASKRLHVTLRLERG